MKSNFKSFSLVDHVHHSRSQSCCLKQHLGLITMWRGNEGYQQIQGYFRVLRMLKEALMCQNSSLRGVNKRLMTYSFSQFASIYKGPVMDEVSSWLPETQSYAHRLLGLRG